jgi:hypothetical protein
VRAGLLLLALAMLPAIAAAGDTAPGSMCQPKSPSDQFIRDADGRMFNVDPKGTPRQFWICPIVRSEGTRFLLGSIVVIDQNSEAEISCSLCQALSNANSSQRCLTKTTENFNPSREPRILAFAFSEEPISSTVIYSFFGCLIPPSDNNNHSGVVSYRWAPG